MGHIDTFMFDGDFLDVDDRWCACGNVIPEEREVQLLQRVRDVVSKTRLDLDFMRMSIASETKRQVRLDINPKLMNNMMARIRVHVPPYDEQMRITSASKGSPSRATW